METESAVVPGGYGDVNEKNQYARRVTCRGFVVACDRLKLVLRGYGIGAQPAERSSAIQQDGVLRYVWPCAIWGPDLHIFLQWFGAVRTRRPTVTLKSETRTPKLERIPKPEPRTRRRFTRDSDGVSAIAGASETISHVKPNRPQVRRPATWNVVNDTAEQSSALRAAVIRGSPA